eukprot:6466168-Amphidinium_carterae.2
MTLVSEETRRVLLGPDVLRRPADEAVDPLPTARVNMDSQEEYDDLMPLLRDWGMIETSPPHSAVGHKGRRVRNGVFGVRRRWDKDERGNDLGSFAALPILRPPMCCNASN